MQLLVYLERGATFGAKKKKPNSNEDPKYELHAKLQEVCPFPGLPYVLGYHSTGSLLKFSKILTGNAVDIAGPLNLNDAAARLQCWNIMRNVARLLNHMVTAPGPTRVPMDMEDLEKGGGDGLDWRRTIRFSGGHVVKEYIVETDICIQKQRRVELVISVLQQGLEGVQPKEIITETTKEWKVLLGNRAWRDNSESRKCCAAEESD